MVPVVVKVLWYTMNCQLAAYILDLTTRARHCKAEFRRLPHRIFIN